MALRIVIDARHLTDFGVGTYIRNLSRALAEIDRENRYVMVTHPDDLPELSGLPENFETVACEATDAEPLDNLRFPLFARRFRADVYHVPLYRVPFFMPRPYVATVHDLSALVYAPRDEWRNHLRLYQVRRGLRRAGKVIAVSAATRRDVENILGIPPRKIRLIYNAPDPRFLSGFASVPDNAAADARRRQHQRLLDRYQVDYPFVLYVGNIRPQKNIPRLIEAFAVLRNQLAGHQEYNDLRLIIIGDEISRYPAVRLAAMQSRVENVVRFLGFVPIDALRVFYEAASVFAFPSLHEGFGLPPLEAMAAGTPVVTSNSSSLPEVVGDAAIVVNPENVFDIARGLRDGLLDQELRSSLISRGFAQVRRFSWRSTAEDVLATYREVAAGAAT